MVPSFSLKSEKFIFSIQVDSNKLHRGIENRLVWFVLSCMCSFFFSFTFFINNISTTIQDRKLIFDMHVESKMFCWIENWLSLGCSSLQFSLFFFSPCIHCFFFVIVSQQLF